jgi:group I intron endonuclease
MITIYRGINKLNGKMYIGQTNDFYHRIIKHKHRFNSKYDFALYRDNNFDDFVWEVLLEVNTRVEAKKYEQYCISFFNTRIPFGYNMNKGGDGQLGFKLSEESKEKISKSKKGIKTGKQSKPRTEEHKLKLSLSGKGISRNKGFVLSEETKQKMSIAKIGKHISDEAKNKLSLLYKGRSRRKDGTWI